MAAGEIGAAMHITTGTMTSVLDTLERKGYVQRVRDPEDRRRVLVDVTPAAQEVLDVLLPEVAHTATQALAEILADELEALRRTLGRISEAIAALPDDLERSTVRRTPPHLRRG